MDWKEKFWRALGAKRDMDCYTINGAEVAEDYYERDGLLGGYLAVGVLWLDPPDPGVPLEVLVDGLIDLLQKHAQWEVQIDLRLNTMQLFEHGGTKPPIMLQVNRSGFIAAICTVAGIEKGPPMIDYTRLAKALGWMGAGEDHYWIAVDLIPKEYIDYAERDWGLVYDAGYEDDDDGQVIVASYHAGWWIGRQDFEGLVENGDLLLAHLIEEKVRELLGGKELEYTYNRLTRAGYHCIRIDGVDFEHEAKTKFEAFAAALVWLAERRG